MNISEQTIANFTFDLMYNPLLERPIGNEVFFGDLIKRLCNNNDDKELNVYKLIARKYDTILDSKPIERELSDEVMDYQKLRYNRKDVSDFIALLDFMGVISVPNMILLNTKFDNFMDFWECLQDE